MKRRTNQLSAPEQPEDPQIPAAARFLSAATWIVVVSGLILTGVLISLDGEESFRYPKELAMRAEAILLATIYGLALIFTPRHLPLKRTPRPIVWMTSAIIGWTAITTLTSTHPRISLESLGWVVVCAMVFLFTLDQVRDRSVEIVWIAIAPAIINAAVAVVQQTTSHRPVAIDELVTGRIAVTGLLGNPNDVGVYLVLPLIASLVLFIVARRKIAPLISAATLAAGVAATVTVTAVAALAAATIAAAVRLPWRRAVAAAVLCAALLIAATLFYPPFTERAGTLRSAIASKKWNSLGSLRLMSTLIALEMFADRPLLGSGPGTYSAHSFDYKIRIEARNPVMLEATDPMKRVWVHFTETHNDHAEVLATTGLPGWVLLLTSIGLFLYLTLRSDGDSREARFAKLIVVPAAVAAVILLAGFFVLELASMMHSLLFFAAAAIAWSGKTA